MQALATRNAQRSAVARTTRAARSVAPRGVVRCNASLKVEEVAKKAAAFAASVPAMLVASPAFALVDDRLNGDGTGKVLGVNDPVLGWVIFGVASTIWILYFTSQRDLGDFEDPDAGAKID